MHWNGMTQLIDCVEIDLKNDTTGTIITVYIDVHDNSLSRKWLTALNHLITNEYHLEKNYCFFGFPDGPRNGAYLIDQINTSITSINASDIGYHINDHFTLTSVLDGDRSIRHDRFNRLHKYFEDLQGVSGNISPYYAQATATTRWHIRQLNLLCHEFESWALSWKKKYTAPEWIRPSQLMCWLNAPRFTLDAADYELFGIDTINRPLGGVFVGVNKAVGKHHWEVFQDEGRDSRIGELTTTTLRAQTEAAGDFDIEWANNPGTFPWQIQNLKDFGEWLVANNFDPEDKSLTIGHPQVGQVDLTRSFGSTEYKHIWDQVASHLNVHSIRTGNASVTYSYNWSDSDYMNKQMEQL
jgi:hypothetical protein